MAYPVVHRDFQTPNRVYSTRGHSTTPSSRYTPLYDYAPLGAHVTPSPLSSDFLPGSRRGDRYDESQTPRHQYISNSVVRSPNTASGLVPTHSNARVYHDCYNETAESPSSPSYLRPKSPPPPHRGPITETDPAYMRHYAPASPRRVHYPAYSAPVSTYTSPKVSSLNRPTIVPTSTRAPPRTSQWPYGTTENGNAHRKVPAMIEDPLLTFLPPQHPRDSHRLCLALDLDETLVYARDGPIHVRPFAKELLLHLHDTDCEVIVWTAGEREYAQSVIRLIDPLGTIEHCVYRHHKWWTGQVGYAKNLRALGRNISRTLLVDNTPDCLKEQPQNGLLVSDFEGPRAYDDCLRALLRVIQAIVGRPYDSVPRVLADCPEVVRRTVPMDAGGTVTVWTLVEDDIESRYNSATPRCNRDSPGRSASRCRW